MRTNQSKLGSYMDTTNLCWKRRRNNLQEAFQCVAVGATQPIQTNRRNIIKLECEKGKSIENWNKLTVAYRVTSIVY